MSVWTQWNGPLEGRYLYIMLRGGRREDCGLEGAQCQRGAVVLPLICCIEIPPGAIEESSKRGRGRGGWKGEEEWPIDRRWSP